MLLTSDEQRIDRFLTPEAFYKTLIWELLNVKFKKMFDVQNEVFGVQKKFEHLRRTLVFRKKKVISIKRKKRSKTRQRSSDVSHRPISITPQRILMKTLI